jgi:hypothetical protein
MPNLSGTCLTACSMLVVITLVIFSRRFHRHRQSGAPFASFGKWGNGEPNGSDAGAARVAAPTSTYQDQSGPNKSGAGQFVQAVPSQYGNTPQQPAMQAVPAQLQHMHTPTGTPGPIYQQQGFPPPGAPGSPQPMMVQQPMPGQLQMVSPPVNMIAQPMPQGQFVPQQQQQPQMFAPPGGAPMMMMSPPMGQPQFQMMPPPQQQQGYWQPQFMQGQQPMYLPPQNMAYAPTQAMQVPVRQVSPVPTPPQQGGMYQPPPLGGGAPLGPPSPLQHGVAIAQPPSPVQHPVVTDLPVGVQQQQQQWPQ